MKIVADLHLHSKYSRAVSPHMNLPTMAEWAQKKGINLLATGDWTHPLYLNEIKSQLVEENEGIYKLKEPPAASRQFPVKYILSTEISCIYSQGGKGRRIHLLVLPKNIETAEKINEKLKQRGCNLLSDGRPILGISAKDLAELIFSIDEKTIIIPAHCLLPEESIHAKDGIRKIKEIRKGDLVLTHKNRWEKVKRTFVRLYNGKIYQIIPDYFRLGITTTGEHPFYAIKTKKYCPSINRELGICKPTCSQLKKCCARQHFKKYKPQWVQAKFLERGDVLLYPRFSQTKDKKFIKLTEYIKFFNREGEGLISAGGSRKTLILDKIKITRKFCRLTGYYLAEGYTTRDLVSFCFSESEKKALEEVKSIVRKGFNIKTFKEYRRKNYKSIELSFYSKVLYQFFSNFFYDGNGRRANNKCLPAWMLKLPLVKQKEILIGWWQGDKGYSTSRQLMNQMKVICLRLGIVPSIGVDSKTSHEKRGKHDKFENRTINAQHDTYHFSNLSFFEDRFGLLDSPLFSKYKTRMQRKRGWIDEKYIYLPIRKIIRKRYRGKVYNLEVERDNSYTAEFALVHNCWTPWFALYGSKSGFDSIDECFGEFSKNIYAVETGLSSDPAANWRIKELDSRSIVSFSDAHSPAKLGRELTIFQRKEKREKRKNTKKSLKSFSFEDLRKAIMQKNSDWEIAYTIEFYPEEGKYHYTGHRKCGVVQSPSETKKKGSTCPVCGRPLTVGVMHRVEELAGQDQIEVETKQNNAGLRGYYLKGGKRPPYVMLVPLVEILAEVFSSGSGTKTVLTEYDKLILSFGSEFDVLTKTDIEKLARASGERLAEAVLKVRKGDIFVDPGYDGEFGKVKVWRTEGKKEKVQEQMSMF